MVEERVLYRLSKISKVFPGVKALDNVDFKLYPGKVHGLVGRNGAGKSTLVNILYGEIKPTTGSLILEDREIVLNNPIDGLKLGIAMVPQEPMVFPNLSVAENLFQPDFIEGKSTFIKWDDVTEQCNKLLKKLNMNIEHSKPVSDLSIGQQQLLLAGKAFYVNKAKVILLDEISTSMSIKDKEILYSMINKKKKEGCAIVFITHNIKEIFEISDQITVIKDGRMVTKENINIKDTTPEEIIKLMFGEDYKFKSTEHFHNSQVQEEKLLVVENLTRIGEYEKINFYVKKHEVLGLVGLRGAGKTELLQTIAGIRKPLEGRIKFKDMELTLKSPNQALEKGIVYLPEDREKYGLVSILSVMDNLTFSNLNKLLGKTGLIDTKKEKEEGEYLVNIFQINTPSLLTQVAFLSGGNKQKVIFGRVYGSNPELYLLDEPTRGIDVEAKGEILKLIKQKLTKKSSVIVTSPEIEDLLVVCDRIAILFEGKLIKILERPFDVVHIYGLMQGIKN